MARQLDRMLAGGGRAGTVRTLRNRLAMTTILAVTPFLGYGRQAYAACVEGPPSTYTCSDTSTGESISDNNANVSTIAAPPFVVTTDGVEITGDGHIQFTDNNASSITNTSGPGLYVRSGGDYNGTDGAVTISTNGDITGSTYGIVGLNYGSGNLSITADGEVTGLGEAGILALNSSAGNDLTVNTGAQSSVTGAYDGITAINNGRGNLIITANGEVEGLDGNGIYAENTSNGNGLTINAGAGSSVTGSTTGIGGHNEGRGGLEIIANGTVTGNGGAGIYGYNSANGSGLTITTGAQSAVTGARNGIDAENFGGDLEVTANGVVTGQDGDGIFASNSFDSTKGKNLTITTGAQSNVTGSENGIYATNFGSGDLEITVNGQVTGEGGDGIHAYNAGPGTYYPSSGVNLTVTTGVGSVVIGSAEGMDIYNYGTGNLTINANGSVTGQGAAGIYAYNSSDGGSLKITTGTQSLITGADNGIDADQEGVGNLEITVNGQVTGEGKNGIYASNAGDGKLIITTGAQSVITGADDGIETDNHGYGDQEITVDGIVTGLDGDGIHASNSSTSDNQKGLKITTGAASIVTGDGNGIYADNFGDLNIDITVNGVVEGTGANGIYSRNAGDADTIIKIGAKGLVQGSESGIYARSGFLDSGQDIFITNNGVVRNLSGSSVDRAIVTLNGPATIDNNALLLGTVTLNGDFDDTLNNAGLWNMAGGSSDLGGGLADEVNNSGTLRAADDATTLEVSDIFNIENFNNSGLVTLVDGQAGDGLTIGKAANYTGNNGRLAVDAFLAEGPVGLSDTLFISDTALGTTRVVVNLTNPIGSSPNYDGIAVVTVNALTTSDNFKIDGGVLNAGFFAWDLRLDGNTHELYTTGLGAGAYEFAAGMTAAQDIWYQTTGTLLQRQADLRPIIAAQQVTPVADFVTPVEPTPIGRVTPGLWFKAVGGWLNRDGDADNNVVLDRKQTVFGGIGGFDFGTENLSEQGDALLFGLFGGYLTSKLDFDSTNTEWKYDGPTIGVYATYLNGAFYADAIVKADFLDIDIDADDLAPDAQADTNATNIGGQIDMGYKVGFGQGAFIEPQASLAVLHTEIDDVDDIFGGSVEFDDGTSVRGRLGLRLGADYEQDGLLLTPDVTASVWQSFTGDNTVTVFAPLSPANDVSDDPGETVGDVSVGFAVTAPDGWSGFLRGNYQFAEDFEAITGNAGLRYAW